MATNLNDLFNTARADLTKVQGLTAEMMRREHSDRDMTHQLISLSELQCNLLAGVWAELAAARNSKDRERIGFAE